MNKKRIGIALGGGGTRGFAHLGALKALEENGIVPDIISGTSAGAIIGSLLATGKSPDEIFDVIRENKLTDFAKISLPTNGFMSLDHLQTQFESLIPGDDFSKLDRPLYVAVTNLLTGKVEYLSEGSVSLAVKASSSIPILFSPVEINGQWYVDGGLLDNLPVEPLLGQCSKIIAIDIMPLEKMEKVEGLPEIAARSFQISVRGHKEERTKTCDLVLRLEELVGYHILDTDHVDEIFNIGYKHTLEQDLSAFTAEE